MVFEPQGSGDILDKKLSLLEETLLSAVRACDGLRVALLLAKGAPANVRLADGTSLLHIAAIEGRLDVIESLLLAGARRDVLDGQGQLPVHIALKAGHGEAAILLLSRELCTRKDSEGQTPLHRIVEMQDPNLMLAVLAMNPSLKSKNVKGATPFQFALEKENVDVVTHLVSAEAEKEGNPYRAAHPLHHAAANESVKVVKRFIELGYSVNEQDRRERTPLSHAVLANRLETAKLLVDEGAQPRVFDEEGNSLVHLAGYEEMLDWLVNELELPIDGRNKEKETPLFRAYRISPCVDVEMYLRLGAHVDVKDANGTTLLHLTRNRSQAQLLLRLGVDINAKDNSGRTPLETMQDEERDIALLELMVCAGATGGPEHTLVEMARAGDNEGLQQQLSQADADTIIRHGAAALFHAVSLGNVEAVRILLEGGVDANAVPRRHIFQEVGSVYDRGFTPLHRASYLGNIEIVSLLLEYGAGLDKAAGAFHTPLTVAAQRGHSELVKMLIDSGSSVEPPIGCRSALHNAVAAGNEKIVNMLLEADHPVNCKDSHKHTPLDIAISEQHFNLVAKLREKGASSEDIWYGPIHVALARKNFLKAQVLALDEETPLTGVDSEGRTALHAAASWGALDVVEALVERGSKVDEREWLYGATPLHLAVLLYQTDTVIRLLNLGADPLMADNRGVRPIDVAQHTEQLDIVALFPDERTRGDQTTSSSLVELQNLEILLQDVRERYMRMLDGLYWEQGGTQTREACLRMFRGTVAQLRDLEILFPIEKD